MTIAGAPTRAAPRRDAIEVGVLVSMDVQPERAPLARGVEHGLGPCAGTERTGGSVGPGEALRECGDRVATESWRSEGDNRGGPAGQV